MNSIVENFDKKVKFALSNLIENFDTLDKIALGVSGGADSIALLTAVSHIFNGEIFVLTINHRIRNEKESAGDAIFVKEYCERCPKNHQIKCTIKDFEKGLVQKVSKEKKCGTEAAARFLRYGQFEDFSKNNNIKYFCLAHTKNDNEETILMRFLQGSSAEGLCGIKQKRKIFNTNNDFFYVRPLLEISRSEIEEYLRAQNILWRTDSTNAQNDYLRNRIRNILIPALNETLSSWQEGVLTTSQKAQVQNAAIETLLKDFLWHKTESNTKEARTELWTPLTDFNALALAARYKAIYNGANCLKVLDRVQFNFVKNVVEIAQKGKGSTECSTLEANVQNGKLFLKNYQNQATEFGFFDIISSEGFYSTSFGIVTVKQENGFYCADFEFAKGKKQTIKGIELPFCIRSVHEGDEILCGKTFKSVIEFLSSEHFNKKVSAKNRPFVPILQELCGNKKIIAVLASNFGGRDYLYGEDKTC